MSKVISKMAVDLNYLKGRGIGAGGGGGGSGGSSSIIPDSSSSSVNNLHGRSSRHDNVETAMFRATQATRAAAVEPSTGSAFENNAASPPTTNLPPPHCSPRWRQNLLYFAGILLTLSCAVCFSGASYMSHRLFRWPTFHAPFFTAFFVSSWLLVFFPAYVLVKFVADRGNVSFRIIFSENVRLLRQDCLLQSSIQRLLGIFSSLILLWILTHYVFLLAVDVVDTNDVLALFATNSNFVYILSWIMLHKKFISTRIVSFIISMTGIMMVTYKDTNFPTHIWGCCLALLANVFCACYRVVFLKLFSKCSSGQLSMCLSFLGAVQTVTLWPLWLVLYYTGWESIQWNCIPWTNLIIIALFAVGVNLMQSFGPSVINIIFVRSAFVVAIVTGVVSEAVFNPSFQLGSMQIIAYLLVLLGFILNNLSQERLEQWASQYCSRKTDGSDDSDYTSYQRIRRGTISYA